MVSIRSFVKHETGIMQNNTAIFYDGACHLCSREINHYRVKDRDKKLSFIDIAAKDFDASQYGLDPIFVHRHIHVKKPNGDIVTGIDAFSAIWKELGILRPLQVLVDHEPSRSVARVVYDVFSRLRVYLPKKKCDDHCRTDESR